MLADLNGQEISKIGLILSIYLSIDASVAEFDGQLYKQLGGSLIVQIANIAVFFALSEVLYRKAPLMKDIVDIKRYIDDGIGIHCMSKRKFSLWTSRL